MTPLFRAGSGEPLVLVHGATGTWQHWTPILDRLAERFEVIAPTLAGHFGGPSIEGIAITNPLKQVADRLHEQLDELCIDTAHFVGNSLGGLLAIEAAARGRARSVTTFSAGGGWEIGSGEARRIGRFFARTVALSKHAPADAALRRPLARKIAMRDIMRHGERVSYQDALALARGTAGCAVNDVIVSSLRAGTDLVQFDLADVRVPVLLAWGTHDKVVPAARCSSRLRRELPESTFRWLPDCGHVPMWDNPALVANTIVEWVGTHDESKV